MNNPSPFSSAQDERERRWRLILGKVDEQDASEEQEAAEGAAEAGGGGMSERDQALDDTLNELYGNGDDGGDDDARPEASRWLSDIHRYFPEDVAHFMQKDALNKLNLRKLLRDSEFLQSIEPDLELATQLLTLRKALPEEARESARQIVQSVVDKLVEELEYPLRQAVLGSLQKAVRTHRPKFRDINWLRTIHANLQHYQPDQKAIIPETLVGFGRQRESLKNVILCVDQSGSMMQSVVYASVFGSVLASLPALDTKMVVFSSDVVDLTEQMGDPVEALLGAQLRGGTNIDRALAYCQQLVEKPDDTLLVLVTDLFENNIKRSKMVQRLESLTADGVQTITLLALSDQGTPRFNRKVAQELVNLGIPSFACTPELFPDLMGAALSGNDISQWAGANGIIAAPMN